MSPPPPRLTAMLRAILGERAPAEAPALNGLALPAASGSGSASSSSSAPAPPFAFGADLGVDLPAPSPSSFGCLASLSGAADTLSSTGMSILTCGRSD